MESATNSMLFYNYLGWPQTQPHVSAVGSRLPSFPYGNESVTSPTSLMSNPLLLLPRSGATTPPSNSHMMSQAPFLPLSLFPSPLLLQRSLFSGRSPTDQNAFKLRQLQLLSGALNPLNTNVNDKISSPPDQTSELSKKRHFSDKEEEVNNLDSDHLNPKKRKRKAVFPDKNCPICGVTLKPTEIESHVNQELTNVENLQPRKLATPSAPLSAKSGERFQNYLRVQMNRQQRLKSLIDQLNQKLKRSSESSSTLSHCKQRSSLCPICLTSMEKHSNEERIAHIDNCLRNNNVDRKQSTDDSVFHSETISVLQNNSEENTLLDVENTTDDDPVSLLSNHINSNKKRRSSISSFMMPCRPMSVPTLLPAGTHSIDKFLSDSNITSCDVKVGAA